MKGHKAPHHRHPRAEHAKGGKVQESPAQGVWADDEAPSEVYAGKGSNVEKEAKEKKHGGRAKRKHGGAAKHVGMVAGMAAKKRADRPARKRGGKVGADQAPLSTAHAGKEPAAHKSYEPEHD